MVWIIAGNTGILLCVWKKLAAHDDMLPQLMHSDTDPAAALRLLHRVVSGGGTTPFVARRVLLPEAQTLDLEDKGFRVKGFHKQAEP